MRKTYYLDERPRIGIAISESGSVTIASATGNYVIFDSAKATVATGDCMVEVSGPAATAFFYQNLTTNAGFTANAPYGYQIEVTATVGTQSVVRIYEDRFELKD